ncbi:unnamed protein product [Toxocara canis]|uniref:Uncharacterized protein n=1 Tax=Toxocara canis TaxID=6265 RepID=A0A183UEH8_TOXCA|nr:unnamed protein product [Toxocara canis]
MYLRISGKLCWERKAMKWCGAARRIEEADQLMENASAPSEYNEPINQHNTQPEPPSTTWLASVAGHRELQHKIADDST